MALTISRGPLHVVALGPEVLTVESHTQVVALQAEWVLLLSDGVRTVEETALRRTI